LQITSLQVNEENLLKVGSLCLHVYVPLLFKRLVEIKIEIESRLYCIDIYKDD